MRKFGFAYAVVALFGAIALGQDMIDNPEFASWSKFKPGTSVTVTVPVASRGPLTARPGAIVRAAAQEMMKLPKIVRRAIIAARAGARRRRRSSQASSPR